MIEDRFRKLYSKLEDGQKDLISDIKDQAMELEALIDRVSENYDVRCAHIAMTKLEEAAMWAVKGASINVRQKSE